nr:hypothetical protein [Tanacetum cinerariifolium]
MSTQQDIYAAGSENCPPMLNKDNYVPWSSRIIRYARSRPNGKMIVNSIENEPYRLISDSDDQAIQTILLGLPEEVYAAVDSCETAKEIWERVRQVMKGLDIEEHEKKYNPQPSLNQNFMQLPMTSLEDINDPTEAMNAAIILFTKAFQLTAPTNNNQRTSSNPRNRQIAQLVMNMSHDRQTQNVGGRIQGAQNVVQNAGVPNGRNQNGLLVVPGIANQNRTGNVVTARAEGTGIGNQASCYNCRGLVHIARNCTARPRRRDASYL